MQQLREYQFSKPVGLVRDERTYNMQVRGKQTWRLTFAALYEQPKLYLGMNTVFYRQLLYRRFFP